jgi:hypothetical protein
MHDLEILKSKETYCRKKQKRRYLVLIWLLSQAQLEKHNWLAYTRGKEQLQSAAASCTNIKSCKELRQWGRNTRFKSYKYIKMELEIPPRIMKAVTQVYRAISINGHEGLNLTFRKPGTLG